ncbi:MAG: pyocin knob domain-containing protein, partial [Muribaculaceae bacterium]|nr:pyocin knob domain-containing protein [Muribaculaceae bacterium]
LEIRRLEVWPFDAIIKTPTATAGLIPGAIVYCAAWPGFASWDGSKFISTWGEPISAQDNARSEAIGYAADIVKPDYGRVDLAQLATFDEAAYYGSLWPDKTDPVSRRPDRKSLFRLRTDNSIWCWDGGSLIKVADMAAVDAINTRLSTLVGEKDVTKVIDTFNEMEAFLAGITNTQTLTGMLADLKADILAQLPTNHVTTDSTQTISGPKTFTAPVVAKSFKTSDGTASQFVKGDGSLDSRTYLTEHQSLDDYMTLTTEQEVTGRKTFCNSTRFKNGTGASGYDVYVELWRDNKASWRMLNTDGVLKLQCNYTTAPGSYYDVMSLEYNTGKAKFRSDVTANKIDVTSTDKVANLNADMLDGCHESAFLANKIASQEAPTLDGCTRSGAYRLPSPVGGTGTPDQLDAGQMLVLHGASDTITQLGIPWNSAKRRMMWRGGNPLKTGGSWQQWVEVPRMDTDIEPLKTAVARLEGRTADDIDALTQTGVYRLTSPQTILGIDDPIPTGSIVTVSASDGAVSQMITTPSTPTREPDVYVRTARTQGESTVFG